VWVGKGYFSVGGELRTFRGTWGLTVYRQTLAFTTVYLTDGGGRGCNLFGEGVQKKENVDVSLKGSSSYGGPVAGEFQWNVTHRKRSHKRIGGEKKSRLKT